MARVLVRLAIVAAACAAAAVAWFGWFASSPIDLRAAPLEFRVLPGATLRTTAKELANAGCGFAPWQFELLGRLLGKAQYIKAGSYEAAAGVTPLQLLDKLTRGDVSQAEVAFIEGWTFRQMRAALDAHAEVAHDTHGLDEAAILARIGVAETSAEGLFFPDTYLFDKNASDLEILRRAYRAMERTLGEQWRQRDASVPYRSPYEALIVASLVEKETGVAADRPLIAAVFVNRLRQGMMLQSDPSVIYGIGQGFDGDLRRRDLKRDTAYNTYTRTGLPPTPIAIPGLASLQAALHPARSDYLYFVARGDGSSQFSRTIDEHNRAVTRFQSRRN